MTLRLRSIALVLVGLTAMSVAPAQAYDTPEPLISVGSTAFPAQTVLQPIQASVELPALPVEVVLS